MSKFMKASLARSVVCIAATSIFFSYVSANAAATDQTTGGGTTTAKPATPATVDPAKVRAVIREQSETESAARQAQQKINQLDDQSKSAVSEYRSLIRETASLKRFNDQLIQQEKSQLEEMVSIQKQLVQIDTTSKEIIPLMQKMLETLDQFVQLDVPFLPDERKNRIAVLKEMMARADVSISEKFRRIVEAYQVEMEYGRTLEGYQGKVKDRNVEFLRAGRVALLYQTLDGSETGYWDSSKKDFVEDNGYRDAVKSGLKIAKKQAAPDLLIVPVKAPVETR